MPQTSHRLGVAALLLALAVTIPCHTAARISPRSRTPAAGAHSTSSRRSSAGITSGDARTGGARWSRATWSNWGCRAPRTRPRRD